MNKHYSTETKIKIIQQYSQGVSISELSKNSGASRSTIYQWIDKNKQTVCKNQNLNLRDYHDLVIKCERQQKIIEILKSSPCTVSAPLRERYEVIKTFKATYSETLLCDALNVSKGSYYNHIFRNKNEANQFAQKEEEMTPLIEKIYNESNQIYGPGKIQAVLKDRGHTVSISVVRELCIKMVGLQFVQVQKPYTNKNNNEKKIS